MMDPSSLSANLTQCVPMKVTPKHVNVMLMMYGTRCIKLVYITPVSIILITLYHRVCHQVVTML